LQKIKIRLYKGLDNRRNMYKLIPWNGNNSCIKIPLPLIPVDGSNQANSISPGLTEKNPPRQDP